MALRADPVLSRVKLIAEPWDVGPHGWRTGQFPPPFAEWNDRYRDSVRTFWLRRRRPLRPTASPATACASWRPGSPAPRTCSARATAGPLASVNYVAAHDGFTLADTTALRPQAQRGQRRGQPRRPRRQPVLEPRRRGRRRRRGRAARPPPVAAQPARHAAAVHRRADAHRRRRAGPHPARQQQRLLPGQRGLLAGLGPRRGLAAGPARDHPPPARAAAHAPGAAPPRLLRRPARSRGRRPRPGVVRRGRPAHAQRAAGTTRTPGRCRCTWTAPRRSRPRCSSSCTATPRTRP